MLYRTDKHYIKKLDAKTPYTKSKRYIQKLNVIYNLLLNAIYGK